MHPVRYRSTTGPSPAKPCIPDANWVWFSPNTMMGTRFSVWLCTARSSRLAWIAGDEDRSGLPIPGIEQARDDAVEPF